jgi:hypothetical protein
MPASLHSLESNHAPTRLEPAGRSRRPPCAKRSATMRGLSSQVDRRTGSWGYGTNLTGSLTL